MAEIIFPSKPADSHKGETGIVTIVAGCAKYYGAPIICALGAQAAGADLINLHLPQEHTETAKNYSLNFFLKPFVSPVSLGLRDIGIVINDIAHSHCLVIGPGLGADPDTKRAICLALGEASIPTVIDAEALIPEILSVERRSEWLLTPHKGEFERLFEIEATAVNVATMARKHHLTIIVKGQQDIICSPEQSYINDTGCPQMRVGGTGDGLAGILGGFIAIAGFNFNNIISAVHLYGLAGESCATEMHSFTAYELIDEFRFKL